MPPRPSDIACHPPGDTPSPADRICVLGIGNVLWADEGFGVRCIEALQQRHEFAPHVQQATHLLIFDAIDYGLAPGTLKCVANDEVPRFMGAKKMSLHQTGFQEVLMLAQLTEQYPQQVLLIGCQPEELEDYGGSLRPIVKRAMDEALALGLQALDRWGAAPVPRQRPLDPTETVTFAELALGRYEAQRPTDDDACRNGDRRFFPAPT